MRATSILRRAWPLLALAAAGCSSTTISGSGETIQIVYRADTVVDPQVAAQFPACVALVNVTHLHTSWHGATVIGMASVGRERWEIRLTDAPADEDVYIRINDPNACRTDPFGAAVENVFVNGVRLTRVVPTPGTSGGPENGLAFRIRGDGTIVP